MNNIITGPAGPRGETGLTGPRGLPGPASSVPGPRGFSGPRGLQGERGLEGQIGPPGADSTVPGPLGLTGPQGIQGVKGDTGATGPQGAGIGQLATVASTGSYTDLLNTPAIPSALSQLSSDSTHRTLTDQEKKEYQYSLSTGILTTGGNIVVNAGDNTKLDFPAATSLYVDNSDPTNPIIDILYVSARTEIPDSIDVSRKWIGIQRSAPGVGTYIYSRAFTALQRRTIAIRGRVWSNSGTTTVEGIGQYATPAWGSEKTLEDLLDTLGSLNRSKNDFYTNADLTIGKTAGTSFRYTAGSGLNLNSPNILDDASQPVISAYHYHVGQESTGLTSLTSTIDAEHYDLAGVKTAVPAGKFTTQRIHYFPRSGVVDLVYGQAIYDTLQQAIDGISKDTVTISDGNDNTLYGSILRGWLCVQEGSTDLTATAKLIVNSGQGSGGSGAGGAGSSPVDSVNGYVGVVILNPDDLVDTLTTHKFTNATDVSRLANTSGTNTGDQDLSNKVDKISGKGLSTNDYTSSDKNRLANTSGTNTGDQTLSSLGIGNVDNTSDANKPVSTAQAIAIGLKQNHTTALDNVSGTNTGDQDLSGLSTITAMRAYSMAVSSSMSMGGF